MTENNIVGIPSTTIASAHHSGSLLETAEQHLIDTLVLARAGELDAYARDEYRAVQFLLGGGGPSWRATFLLDEDNEVRDGFFTYSESAGTVSIAIPEWELDTLYDTLKGSES